MTENRTETENFRPDGRKPNRKTETEPKLKNRNYFGMLKNREPPKSVSALHFRFYRIGAEPNLYPCHQLAPELITSLNKHLIGQISGNFFTIENGCTFKFNSTLWWLVRVEGLSVSCLSFGQKHL